MSVCKVLCVYKSWCPMSCLQCQCLMYIIIIIRCLSATFCVSVRVQCLHPVSFAQLMNSTWYLVSYIQFGLLNRSKLVSSLQHHPSETYQIILNVNIGKIVQHHSYMCYRKISSMARFSSWVSRSCDIDYRFVAWFHITHRSKDLNRESESYSENPPVFILARWLNFRINFPCFRLEIPLFGHGHNLSVNK